MSDTTTQSDSTDSELAVFVGFLGQLSNERYIKNTQELVARVESELSKVASVERQKVDTVYSRGNYAATQALDAALEADVEHSEVDWRRVLDQERERFSDNDDRMRNGVMLSVDEKIEQWDLNEDSQADYIAGLEDDRPMAEIVAEHADQISDDEWQEMVEAADQVFDNERFNADTDEFTIEDHFDLYIREHRNALPYGEISESRIARAKAAAMGRTDERLYNDWYDTPQTVDAAILLHDGTDRGMEALEAARGQNPWVKYPSSCDGLVIDTNLNTDGDDLINWPLYLLDTDQEDVAGLSDSQISELTDTFSEAELREVVDEETADAILARDEGEDSVAEPEPEQPEAPAAPEAPEAASDIPPAVAQAETDRA